MRRPRRRQCQRVVGCRIVGSSGASIRFGGAGWPSPRVVAGVGWGDVGEGVAGEGAAELADGEQFREVADLGVGPPGCSGGDGGHLVDGEFASPERLDAGGQFVGAAGDGDDLAGVVWCEPGAPGEEELGGVRTLAEPQRLVVEHRDGQVDQPGVLRVQVTGHLVQRRFEPERIGLLGDGIVDGGRHQVRIVHQYVKCNTNRKDVRSTVCEARAASHGRDVPPPRPPAQSRQPVWSTPTAARATEQVLAIGFGLVDELWPLRPTEVSRSGR